MARKTPQTNTDRAIAGLSEDDRAELTRLCESYANATEIHRFLVERCPGLSYGSVLNWYSREYPPGERARTYNSLLQEFRGINPVSAHAAALAHVVRLTDEIMQEIDPEDGREPTPVVDLPPSVLSNLSDLLREQRQSAQALATAQRITDTRQLELAGGYRVAEIIRTLAKGNPQESAIADMVSAAVAQLEKEVAG